MLDTVGTRNRIADSELLFLRKYKCLDCGFLVEYLRNHLENDVKCDQCGSAKLEVFNFTDQCDFYW